jgi:hypothetical protein
MKTGMWLSGLAALALLAAGPAPGGAADTGARTKIRQAIKRGVRYLRRLQRDDGTWAYRTLKENEKRENVGMTALAGLTLLECGAKATDPAVRKAAAAVRLLTVELTYTYSLSLAIMFLDRLGDSADEVLIESMAVRLLAGQARQGTWTYYCPSVSPAEGRRLNKHIKRHAELLAKGQPAKKGPRKRRTARDLSPAIIAQLVQINRQELSGSSEADNSNTQLANLALWIARRHGLPVDAALKRVRSHYRATQGVTGGWTYTLQPLKTANGQVILPSGTMTCAGLLGLAIGEGVSQERARGKKPNRISQRQLVKDRNIARGLAVLAACVGKPLDFRNKGDLRARYLGRQAGHSYYFLWSMERVAMIYGLRTLNKKDWYAWGSQVLLANQEDDGSWRGSFAAGGADTCFALLFLSRSNQAPDLTTILRGGLPPSGEVALKSGGVGGKALVAGRDIQAGVRRRGKGEKDVAPAPKQKKAVIGDPADEQAAQIAKLSGALVKAPAATQGKLLAKYQKAKGVEYTEALAGSIPLLKGAMRAKARTALAERLVRMTTKTLRDKLKDDNLEVRRAAALACATKRERVLVPELIALLTDPEPPVARAAHQALKGLSGKDFGPDEDATRAERRAARKKWQAWWNKAKND